MLETATLLDRHLSFVHQIWCHRHTFYHTEGDGVVEIECRVGLGNVHGRICVQMIATFDTVELLTEYFVTTLYLIQSVFQLFDHAFFQIPSDFRYLFGSIAFE